MFGSFFFAGFEATAAFNRHGRWIDQIAATQHDRFAGEDYRRLREAGLLAAREAVRWPLVDRGGRYDFRTLEPFITASQRHEIEVIWDYFHYGYPQGEDPFSERFARRFAEYCYAVTRHLARRLGRPLFVTPINEPSYLAWAAGEAARFGPYRRGAGRELKISLARAAIAGINAIRAAAPGTRIVNVDPICHVVPPPGRADLMGEAADFNENAVFEAWDILCGRLYPELGGSRAHLGIVGVNYYWTNEWELGRPEAPLAADDPRRVPLSLLLRRVHERYGGELLVTETAHVDARRPEWLRCLADEAERALEAGVELRGICLYPILGMPEWHAPDVWVRMGLWDLVPRGDVLERQLYRPMMDALREARRLDGRRPSRPVLPVSAPARREARRADGRLDCVLAAPAAD